MKNSERMCVGVVLERRRIAHAWQEYAWHALAVVAGAPDIAEPRLLSEGEGWSRYLAATLDIELFASETEGYRYNLSQASPVVYALWRTENDEPDGRPVVFHVTVCPYEAQDYLDGVDVTVESLPMPDTIARWVAGYVARHHVDQPFRKRQRRPHPDGRQRIATEGDEHG
jgi:hypothetical protein